MPAAVRSRVRLLLDTVLLDTILLATVLLLIVAAGVAVVLRGDPDGPAAAPAAATRGPSASATPDGRVSGPAPAPLPAALPRSAPVALRVPALGLSVRLSQLGLNPDGTVEVPTDFQQPGWFKLGPSPGQAGSAVILGHVDSYRGPAVFFKLRTLKAGDRIEVSRADGTVARFAVRTVTMYLKRNFPAREVYGSHGGSALNLVTCGGEFDRRARSYLSNVVVHAALVGPGVTGRG